MADHVHTVEDPCCDHATRVARRFPSWTDEQRASYVAACEALDRAMGACMGDAVDHLIAEAH